MKFLLFPGLPHFLQVVRIDCERRNSVVFDGFNCQLYYKVNCKRH